MKRVLFTLSQTLYAKVLIPLAIEFVQQGYKVAFGVNRPTLFRKSWGFSERYIRNHPTTVGYVTPESLRFVARVIGYIDDWNSIEKEIEYIWRPDSAQFDAIIGTTKNLDVLRGYQLRSKAHVFALGYQHMPFVAKVGDEFRAHTANNDSAVFIDTNPFSESHGFAELLRDCGWELCPFLHLDKVHERHGLSTENDADSDNLVLIFHPGGYRQMVTIPGDSKEISYAKQKALFEQICLPLVRKGYKPVIKIHPLRAKYHDLDDVQSVIRQIEQESNLPDGSILCVGPEAWYWDYALRSRFIFTFGSTSVYELWIAGFRNVFVCSFAGNASRTRKFEVFDAIYIKTLSEYFSFVKDNGYLGVKLDPMAVQVIEAFQSLFWGDAVEKTYRWIRDELHV